jgi:PAS domain S-box-containing protein
MTIFIAVNSLWAEYSKEQLKSLITLKCVEHITWRDQKNIKSLKLGFFGDDQKLYQELKSLASSIQVKNQNIEVVKVTDLAKIQPVEILFVDKSKVASIAKVWQSVEKKNILLVTDECSDARFVMINLVYNAKKSSYAFEINRANMIIEGFNIEPKLLLLGGTEVDVRELYRNMRSDLGVEKNRVKKQAQVLQKLKYDVDEADKSLKEYTEKIVLQKENLEVQRAAFGQLANEVVSQKQLLKTKTLSLQTQLTLFENQKSQIEFQETKIADNFKKLEALQKEIEESKELLERKNVRLDSQSIEMSLQQEKIQRQKTVLYLSMALLLMLVGLGYVIYRAYQMKRGLANQLEIKVLERTKELAKSEESFREIFNATNEVIFIHDADSGKILDVNDAFNKMFGYSGDDVDGLSIGDLSLNQYPFDKSIAIENINRAKKEGPQLFEWKSKRKNGEIFWSEVALKTSELAGEKRILAVLRDISERKSFQQEQEELQERLNQSEKLEAIGHLAGGIAHDFNNQLGGISGFTDLILDAVEGKDETLTEYAQNVITCVKRSSDLTQQLLAYARKGKVLSESVNLHKVVDEVKQLLSHSIDKRIALKVDLDAEQFNIKGDSTQIQNAILNLSINARDAMPDGGDIIFNTKNMTIDGDNTDLALNQLEEGEYIQLTITDTGAGIPKSVINNIFEPFFTTKAEGKGTGMGLAAVYGTIKNHRGNINVYSEEGHGTVFKVYLPIDNAMVTTADIPEAKAVIHQGTGKVLVVDDEEIVRKMTVAMLKKMGYSAVPCEDGFEAVEKYREMRDEIDMVILDLVMPKMSGKDTFKALVEINPDVKVLVSSGYSLNDDAQFILDSGAKGFIQKPFRRLAISEKVKNILDES